MSRGDGVISAARGGGDADWGRERHRRRKGSPRVVTAPISVIAENRVYKKVSHAHLF